MRAQRQEGSFGPEGGPWGEAGPVSSGRETVQHGWEARVIAASSGGLDRRLPQAGTQRSLLIPECSGEL